MIRPRETSAESAARFHALRDRRLGELRNRPALLSACRSERGDCTRAVVLAHVGALTPRLTHEIHRAVVDDLGHISKRRVGEVLAHLVARGDVI